MSKPTPKTEPRKAHVRTCVGCGEKDAPGAFVRLVVAGESVVVDVGRSSFGHGAHVHARPACLVKACKGGLARAFKARVVASPAELGRDIAAGMDRKLEGLLVAARRAGHLVYGADAVCAALESVESTSISKDAVVVVACDAKTVVSRRPIAEAIARGRSIAWGTKEGLGRLLGREEVALVAVTNASIASELLAVFAQGDACRFLGQPEGRAVAGLGRVSAATSEGR